jgi:hypothetical protein
MHLATKEENLIKKFLKKVSLFLENASVLDFWMDFAIKMHLHERILVLKTHSKLPEQVP